MAALPAPPLRAHVLLLSLCLAVAAVGFAWPAWDMFGAPARPMLQGWDDSFYYFWLPSVVIDHDVDFSNQLAQSGTVNPETRDTALTLPRTATGLLENKYPPGWALGSLPFFLAAHAFAPPHATGFEPRYLLAVWFGQLLYAAAGLWLATQLLRRWFSPPVAVTSALLGWLASPLIYYQTARLSMSHSQVFALAMAVFWLCFRILDGDQRARIWAGLGFCAALLLVTRNVTVVYLALPAYVAFKALRSPRAAAALLLAAAGPLVVQVVAWKLLYGSWLVYSYGGERFDFSNLHLGGVLFSPRHGWFYWHPLLLAGIAAFIGWSSRRVEGWLWLLSLVAIVLLDAAWPTWWLGSSFGHRGFEVPTFFAMLGLGVILDAVRLHPGWRRAAAVVAGVAVAWNLALLALFLTQRIPRGDPVTYPMAVRALTSWLPPGP